jgi:hypothetical protein
LSKCKQQQEEEETFLHANDECEEVDGQFDIPGLQFVKVTDDSFRQMQKSSLRLTKQSPKVEKPIAQATPV